MTNWTRIASLEEIPRLGARTVHSAQGDIAVFRTGDDKVFALHDHCPHKGGPLSQGIVFGDKVACPLHNWRINLVDGNAEEPDEGQTTCFSVKVEDGSIYLAL